MSIQDKKFMKRAIEIASGMLGKTHPNPPVGCVIVKDGELIAEAGTNIGGAPHAEVAALKIAKKKAKGATMYVTLEPCSHKGKNPPCVEKIINAGIAKVFIASKDPYFKVNGKGIQTLKSAGIEVVKNYMEKEAYEVNKYFFTRIKKNRPYVTIKIAASLDGKIALSNGDSKWITSKLARNYAHQLRQKNEAILTGIGTVLADNPSLNCRLKNAKKFSPVKFIIDKNLQIPKDAKILKGKETYIFTGKDSSQKIGNAKIIKVKKREDARLDLEEIFEEIANLNFSSLLVEAGQALVSDLIKYGLVDEVNLITAPKILGSDAKNFVGELNLEDLPENSFEVMETRTLGNDVLTVFKNTAAG